MENINGLDLIPNSIEEMYLPLPLPTIPNHCYPSIITELHPKYNIVFRSGKNTYIAGADSIMILLYRLVIVIKALIHNNWRK